ncbi:MAG: hypothetical protein Q9182_003062 [Xanthomendoza sp. 2 TL-2023]
MTSTIGIPIKLLNEAQNHVITLEITSGQVYRGKLIEAEDNMNVQLKDITVTARDGRVSHLDQVYIRGSHVRFFIVPDMLRTTIPIWHDTISPTPKALQEWATEWQAPEAREVIKSLGAWIVVTQEPSPAQADDHIKSGKGEDVFTTQIPSIQDALRTTLSTIHDTIAHHSSATDDDYDTTPLLLLISTPPQPLLPLRPPSTDEWEDLGLDSGGWQYIDSTASGKNEFYESTGLERLKEALEAHEWDAGDDFDADGMDDFETSLGLREGDDDTSSESVSIGLGREDDRVGLREAMLPRDELGKGGEDGDEKQRDMQVAELETMMIKMQAVKERGASMPEEDRKRLAAKAVREIMKSV